MAETHTLDESTAHSELNQGTTKAPSAQTFSRFTPRMALQLAAPHTWPAAVLPVLLAAVLAIHLNGQLSILMVIIILAICILMQASVNTINDYYDFVKGTDRADESLDPSDAVLLYNHVNPKAALALALSLLGVAFVLGCYVIYHAGWIPLAIGLVGALMVLLYSAGKSPISYLPLGEYVSGITMGGLIPLAGYHALTGVFDPLVLLFAAPIMLGIGLIMFTNNTCDMVKDKEAGRKTQAVLLGYKRARKTYQAVLIIWMLIMTVLIAAFFTRGLVALPFVFLLVYPSAAALFKNPLTASTRIPAMTQCLNVNIILGLGYVLAIAISMLSF